MMARFKWMRLRVVAVACVFGMGHIATAQVIDFEDRECPGAGGEEQGKVVEEDGFRLTKGDGEPFDYKVRCTESPQFPCSTALYNNTVNGQIILRRIDGEAFTAASIGLVPLGGAGVIPVNFVGTKSNGDQVKHAVRTDGRGPNECMEDFAFPDDFDDLVSLEWTQQSPFHQFDDVVLGAGGSKCSYTLKKSKAKGGCDNCPKKGSEFKSEQGCEVKGDCKKTVKTKISCPNGKGTCKLKAKKRKCG